MSTMPSSHGTKSLRLRPEQIRALVPDMGGCVASDRITVDGKPVGSMSRTKPSRDEDSGWVFLAGDESQAYLDNPAHFAVYAVNTIANYDLSVVPYLYALPGQRFERDPKTGRFHEAADSHGNKQEAGIPRGMDVVQGRVPVAKSWSIDLPWPTRRRTEDGSIVFWVPRLTLWVNVSDEVRGTLDERFQALKAKMSPAAYDVDVREGPGIKRLSYRLRERSHGAKVPSLYVMVVGARGQVQLGIYADGEDEIAAAKDIVATVRTD